MLRTYWYDSVDPFRELTSLHQWMDQTLHETLNSFVQTPQVVSGFVPQAEVFETDDQVALKIEVPGLSGKGFRNHIEQPRPDSSRGTASSLRMASNRRIWPGRSALSGVYALIQSAQHG